MKINWYLVIGTFAYTVAGMVFIKVVSDYLEKLAEEVAKYDERYCKRLFYHIKVTKKPFNQFLVDVMFITLWPVICIAAILKAEKEYDIIVRHSAFGRRVS